MQSGTLEVFFHPLYWPASLQGIRSMIFVMTGTPPCSLAGFPIVLFLVGRWDCPRGTYGMYSAHFVDNHVKLKRNKQSFCGWMPFLSPTGRNHSLDFIFSLTTKTPEQGRGVTPFTSALRRQYPIGILCLAA